MSAPLSGTSALRKIMPLIVGIDLVMMIAVVGLYTATHNAVLIGAPIAIASPLIAFLLYRASRIVRAQLDVDTSPRIVE